MMIYYYVLRTLKDEYQIQIHQKRTRIIYKHVIFKLVQFSFLIWSNLSPLTIPKNKLTVILQESLVRVLNYYRQSLDILSTFLQLGEDTESTEVATSASN